MTAPVSAVQAVSSLVGVMTQYNPAIALFSAFGVAMFAGMYIVGDIFDNEAKRAEHEQSRDLFLKHLPQESVAEEPRPVQQEAPAPAPVPSADLSSYFH